jgi:hypothetical protein
VHARALPHCCYHCHADASLLLLLLLLQPAQEEETVSA